MNKAIRLLTAIGLLLVMIFPAAVFGASSSVSVSGSSSVKVGETITVTVTYKGDSLGYVNGQLIYDNSKLEYLSGGSSQGDAGLVELKTYADNASGKLPFHLKFRAVGSGNVNLSLETIETQNLDGDQNMGTPSASKTISVAAAPEKQQTTESTKESSEETNPSFASSEPSDSGNAAEPEKTGNDINYPLLSCIAAVIVILIALIGVKLRKKK